MRRLVALLIILIAVAAAAAWALTAPKSLDPATAAAVSLPGDPVAGEIVFHAGGCVSCHATPGQPDTTRLGGGLALKTAFGTFYPPNISPDKHDGIGAWTAPEFATALLLGVSPRGAHLYPAFPYTSYRLMTPKDVRDLFAYLKTLPPVAGRAPPNAVSFPFDIRRAIGFWKLLYMRPFPVPDFAARDEAWRLGWYLVNGPGHCAECHSPRDFLGGIVADERLTGGPSPDGKGKAPSLTAAALKDWNKGDITEALSSGFTPSGDSLGGPMAEVVRNTAQFPASYRDAIAVYLKSDAR